MLEDKFISSVDFQRLQLKTLRRKILAKSEKYSEELIVLFQNFEIFENGTNESIDLESYLESNQIPTMELFCENS